MKTSWNLGLLYKSHTDPAIEKDMKLIEKSYAAFEKKYRTKTDYLKNETKLFFALKDYEALFTTLPLSKPLSYFGYVQDLDANDAVARAKLTQLSERFAKNEHKIVFFELNLAQVSAPLQKKFLASKKLTQYRYFLKCIFEKGKYDLPEAEEKIMGLKAIPSYQMWVNATEKVRNKIVIEHEGERLPLSSAMQKIGDLPLESRRVLHEKVMKALEGISDMAESELNAIVTNKKINDELRGHKEPFNHTILSYQNDRKSVLALVNTVSKHFPISHRFYKLKAKLLKLPHLEYSDRNVGLAQNQKKIPFTEALATVRSVFGSLDKKYNRKSVV